MKTVADFRRVNDLSIAVRLRACYFRAEEGLYPLIDVPAEDPMLLSGFIIGISHGALSNEVFGQWFQSRPISGSSSFFGWSCFQARKYAVGPVGITLDHLADHPLHIFFHQEADAVEFEMNMG